MLSIPTIYDIPPEMLQRQKEASAALAAAKAEIEDFILKCLDVEVGDTVEENRTGLRYVVTHAAAYADRPLSVGVVLMGRRLYKTGRRAGDTAATTSHISNNCTIVERKNAQG